MAGPVLAAASVFESFFFLIAGLSVLTIWFFHPPSGILKLNPFLVEQEAAEQARHLSKRRTKMCRAKVFYWYTLRGIIFASEI